jgi:beta-glucanase (GH16 family)
MRAQWIPIFIVLGCSTIAAQTAPGWQLLWSDEFDGKPGSPPDPTKWNYDIGRGKPPGWGNRELETYTNSTQNAFQDGNGNLVIRALRDSSGNYTSARLQTGAPGASTQTADGHWQYGRILARIKLPYAKGTWPAFWALGESIGAVGWPACGELDIMENFGGNRNNAGVNSGTAHGPGYSGGQGITKAYTLPYGEKVMDDFHVYAIEWSQDSVRWSVDGVVFHKVTPASLPPGTKWVFNAPFFILLNLAVGGNAAGSPDADAPFPPQDMLVDYVRIYQPVPDVGQVPRPAAGPQAGLLPGR